MSAGENDGCADRIDAIKSTLRVVPDFPKPGILFLDITTLLLDPKAFKDTIDLFVERYKQKNISVVAEPEQRINLFAYKEKLCASASTNGGSIEARGFMFGPAIALAIGAKFVPLRKPKKLPGEVISEKYVLEYGTDCLEMHVGAVEPGERALVVDDLVATGGTLCAAMNLLERAGAVVVECACVIEVPDLKGRERLRLQGKPLYVLVESQFEAGS
ncbi:Adenine phosphoribosyl transferase [Cynara cardunculus var. scolymus]|uniref:adenine phosphoribosyltransferase n=1 Tax=Cynara cardunculus var. scolymus TaxID=59895 RepID=A0A124SD14_CYNCS|nr:Adenine phosphoribosyl transferase [Cynara cardunculus var. scolymus]